MSIFSSSNDPKSTASIPETAQASIVYSVVLLAMMGQMLLNPIIAPRSRELGMQEWQMGATISLAAIMVTLTSPFWGERCKG